MNYPEIYKEMLRRGFQEKGSYFVREGEEGKVNINELIQLPTGEFEKWIERFPITENLYRINRSCMWFCPSEEIYHSKMREYFTEKAINSLLKDGMIVIKKTE